MTVDNEQAVVSSSHLVREYLSFKRYYPKTSMFFRLGDTAKTFGDDAVKLHKITGVEIDSSSPLSVASFPSDRLGSYVKRMILAGHRCYVVDRKEGGGS